MGFRHTSGEWLGRSEIEDEGEEAKVFEVSQLGIL